MSRLKVLLGYVLAIGLFFFFSLAAHAASPEYELKAAYIARFVDFVDWPAEAGNPPFHICVFGPHPIEEPLAKLPSLMKAKSRSIQIRRIDSTEAAASCEIVFVPNLEARRMRAIQQAVQNRPVLTVGDTPGLLQEGAMVNFYSEGERLRFEIHLLLAQQAGLKFSSRLLKLASVKE